MSKIVSNMPNESRSNARYPWGEWLDGQTRLLEPGVDFQIAPDAFRSGVYTTAKRRGLKVTVLIRPEGVYLQAHPKKGQP